MTVTHGFSNFVCSNPTMADFEYPRLILSDPEGNVFDHPSLKLSGRSGNRFLLPPLSELVPLPKGSQLFTLPGRIPVGWDEEQSFFICSEEFTFAQTEKE